MRRFALLALTLLMAASAAAFLGQKSASAQPIGIQVVAVSPGVYQVSVNFSSDEIPVSFTVTAPTGGLAASVVSVDLVSCSHPFGSCTASAPDVDASAGSYNSGSGLSNFDLNTSHDPVSFVVSVTLSCGQPSSIVLVATQAGFNLSAPLTCGFYPYAPGLPLYGLPYYIPPFALPAPLPTTYLHPGYEIVGGRALVINGGRPLPPLLVPQAAYTHPGQVLVGGGQPYLGSRIGGIIFGASGTERNLTRHILQQITQQLPSYLAAYGVDPALSSVITQQIVAYVNAYGSNPTSTQQVVQQISAYLAAYGSGQGLFLAPPRTGEAGLVGSEEFPFLTYYEELPADQQVVYQEVVYEEDAE